MVNGRAGGWAEFVAVTSGTEPRVGVGLFITGAGAAAAAVVVPAAGVVDG